MREKQMTPAYLDQMSETIEKWFRERGFDHEQFSRDRFAFHKANPHVPLDTYRSRVLHKLGQIVCQRTLIYLDLKYWINLRNVMLNKPVDGHYTRLFDLLSKEAARGAVICPLSFWVFQELLKQEDAASRRATAALIDKLSNGVAFMPHGELVAQEILHFIRKVSLHYRNTTQWPIHECIWTRTVSFLPDRIPVWGDEVPQEDQLLVQKNWEDFNFFVPLEGLMENAPPIPRELIRVGYNVADINRRKLDVRNQHRSFKSIFLAELMHTIKENEDNWYEVLAYLYFLETGKEEPRINSDQLTEEEARPARNLIWWAFKKNKITDELPSYHIPAALFAASCWDGSKRLTENDIFDFYHAQIGIPYCDIVLTELSLKTLVCSQHLRLDRIYNTEIIADPAEAAQRIAQLREATFDQVFRPILRQLFANDCTP